VCNGLQYVLWCHTVEVLGILEARYQKARIETRATTKALADERLANSDNVVRLRKELAEAKAANEELRGMLQRGATETRAANDVGVRLPAVPDTPCVSAAARGAFRVSELAHDDAEVLEDSTPYATSGGLQLRGTEHLHDRSVGEGIVLSPQCPVGAPSGASTSGGGDSQGLTALAQTIIAGKPVHLQGARITSSQVEAFVKQKRIQLRSGVFLLSQLDGDIDKNAMSIIEARELPSPREKARTMEGDMGRGVLSQSAGGGFR
jgi:hypothetical protein